MGEAASANGCDLRIEPREVARMRSQGTKFLLLDCRRPEEFELARIEGAELVPMFDLDLHIPRLRAHEDDLIVVYCHTGRRSLTVAAVLRDQGFSQTRSMIGGIERWSVEIDPSVPRYTKGDL